MLLVFLRAEFADHCREGGAISFTPKVCARNAGLKQTCPMGQRGQISMTLAEAAEANIPTEGPRPHMTHTDDWQLMETAPRNWEPIELLFRFFMPGRVSGTEEREPKFLEEVKLCRWCADGDFWVADIDEQVSNGGVDSHMVLLARLYHLDGMDLADPATPVP
jgi:hypothetical protein